VNRNAADLRNFFVRCDKLDLFGSGVAYMTMVTLIENGRGDIVHSLFETANENSYLYGLLQIGSALASFRNFDVEKGAVNLRNGLFRAITAGDYDLPDRDLLMKNSFLLETLSWPQTQAFAKPEFEIIHRGQPGNAPYACFTICDPVYFRRFADGFVESVRGALGPVNIFMLLVNPDEETSARAAGYDGVTVAKTYYQGGRLYEFCSAARFALARDVLEATERPTVFMDIDVSLPRDCGAILAEMTRHSVSVFDTGALCPSERISSSVTASRPCDEAFAFWDAAGGFVLANMTREGPVSALGKTALYMAAARGRAAGWDISAQSEGIAIPGAGSALKTDRLYRPETISPEGKVVFYRRDEAIADMLDKQYERKSSLLRGTFNDLDKLSGYFVQNRGDTEKCSSALINFAENVSAQRLHSFFTQCHRMGLHSPNVTYLALNDLAAHGRDDIITSLLDTAKKTDPLYGLFNIGQSFVECRNFEARRCGYYLREGIYHCLKSQTQFSNFGLTLQSAFLMESVEWPPEGRAPLPPMPEIVHKDMFEDSPYILMGNSSPEYFRVYWDKRIKNIRELCPDINILLFLVNPTEDSINEAAAHRGVTVARSLFPGGYTSELFALSALSFFRESLDIFKKPIVGFEMDSQYPPGTNEVFGFMSQCAHVYAKTNDLYPSLYIDGGACAVSPCDDGIASLDTYIDYVRGELTRDGPIYLFDQVSRYRTVAEASQKGWNMIDINEYTGGKFRHYFKDGTDYSYPLEERQKTRTNDDYLFAGMSEDRRCHWIKKTGAPEAPAP
jgi:hypothetical protein